MGTTVVTRPRVQCFVAGIWTQIEEFHGGWDVDSPIGQATLVLPMPLPAHVEENAVVEVIGTRGAESGRIFLGVIRGPDDYTFSLDGKTATLECEDFTYLLALAGTEDVAWQGPVAARTVLRGLFEERGFGGAGEPGFVIDDVVDLDGAAIVLGGVAEFDDGQVRLPALTSWLDWGVDLCRLFGYRVYGTPQGLTRVSAVRGLPDAADSVRTYTEGLDGFSWRRSVDLHGIVGWWEAIGPCATDADGQEVCIRSFPASVPSNPDVPTPPGTDADRVQGLTELLVTQALADLARNVWETDFGGRSILHEWTTDGQPLRRPGEVVTLDAPTVGSETSVWVTRMAHDFTLSEGWVTSFTGWTGNGEALPSGSDVCVDIPLLTGPVHIGDEVVSWYAVPSPTGTTLVLPFTPAENLLSISIRGRHHGSNSQYIDGANTSLTVTRWQVWQSGSQLGEGAMPVSDENYALQLDYTNDANWSPFDVPVPGTVVAGTAAEARLVMGTNPDLPVGTQIDDAEFKDIVLSTCAQGSPTLPGEPTNPTIPPPRPPTLDCGASGAGGTAAYNVPFTLIAAGWTWPANFRYAVLRGVASGLTGNTAIGGGTALSNPAQCVDFVSVGGTFPMIVPGTQNPASVERTGTPKTGGGPVAVWNDFGSTPGSDTVIGFPIRLVVNAISSAPFVGDANCAVGSVCLHFTNDPTLA
jgi:hypothetical protein